MKKSRKNKIISEARLISSLERIRINEILYSNPTPSAYGSDGPDPEDIIWEENNPEDKNRKIYLSDFIY